ncbi:MAG TPA: hypothetical protein VHV81_14210 [Steroidobacteraceae bacterium]|nr:hypothetical protein [Steroidobacteraceae bacterium]
MSVLCIAACADQPPKTAAQPGTPATDADLDKKRLAEAIKHGYKIQNTDGQTLYCRSDWATASHIQKNTVCLTAQQLDDLDQKNDRDYGMPNRAPVSKMP